jgi:hypothetical protein
MLLNIFLPHIIDGAQAAANWLFPVVVETVVENAGHFVVEPSTIGRVAVVGSLVAVAVSGILLISCFAPI